MTNKKDKYLHLVQGLLQRLGGKTTFPSLAQSDGTGLYGMLGGETTSQPWGGFPQATIAGLGSSHLSSTAGDSHPTAWRWFVSPTSASSCSYSHPPSAAMNRPFYTLNSDVALRSTPMQGGRCAGLPHPLGGIHVSPRVRVRVRVAVAFRCAVLHAAGCDL